MTKEAEEPKPQQTAPELGDATDPHGEVIHAEDDRPEIPATKDTDGAPAEELYDGDPHDDHETVERREELDAVEDDDKKS